MCGTGLHVRSRTWRATCAEERSNGCPPGEGAGFSAPKEWAVRETRSLGALQARMGIFSRRLPAEAAGDPESPPRSATRSRVTRCTVARATTLAYNPECSDRDLTPERIC